MKTMAELLSEHRKINPDYTGSPVAPLPRRPEKEPGFTQKEWAYFERMQARIFRGGVGIELDDWAGEKVNGKI